MPNASPRIVSSTVYLLFILLYSVSAGEEPWSFIVLADWHNAETFATKLGISSTYDVLYNQIHHVKEHYGGDLILLPGDSNNGKWTTDNLQKK